MRCTNVSDLMMARLDDQLDDGETTMLEKHLSRCPACRTEWRRLCALDHLFSSTPMVSAPVTLHRRVMGRIGRGERPRQAIIGGLIMALSTVTLMLLTLVPVSLWLIDHIGIAPTLLAGGQRTLAQLMILVEAQIRVFILLLDQLAPPLALVSLGCFALAVALNALWFATVRRLQPAS